MSHCIRNVFVMFSYTLNIHNDPGKQNSPKAHPLLVIIACPRGIRATGLLLHSDGPIFPVLFVDEEV